jgi:hypothetical protein
MGFLNHMEWMSQMGRRGYRQKQCKVCGRWLFACEMGKKPFPIGSRIQSGKVIGVRFANGERYYFTQRGRDIGFMPECAAGQPKKGKRL